MSKPSTPANNMKPWYDADGNPSDDLITLRTMHYAGEPAREIARILKRSERAILMQIEKLSQSNSSRNS